MTHAAMTTTADAPADTNLMIRLDSVTKVFGNSTDPTVALSDVSLDVKRGEFVTIVGQSGCGKSTLLNLIAGLDAPTSGSVWTGGKVAFMFQDATLLPWLTARENIELPLQLAHVGRAERRARVEELLGLVQLQGWGDNRPHELSGGMRQRVSLARCLAQDAQIVLMDEPLGALDAMTRDHLHEEIESLSASQGLTAVFVTHNMREAIRLGDRVVLMGSHPGRILYEQRIELPHPRVMDSPEVATRANDLTKRLKEQGHVHVG